MTPVQGTETERSRWQTVLSEAGGISAALSDDNMKKIKYCLEWLQVRRLDISTLQLLNIFV